MNFDCPPKKEQPHYAGRHNRSYFDAATQRGDYDTLQESQYNRTAAQTNVHSSAMTTLRYDTRRSSHQNPTNISDMLGTGMKNHPFVPPYLNNLETIK